MNMEPRTQHTPISMSILALIRFISIVFILLGILIGVIVAPIFSEDPGERALLMVLGVLLGAILGGLLSIPINTLLRGYAKIVAWYETVPPGCVYVMNAENGAQAPMPPYAAPDFPFEPDGAAPQYNFSQDAYEASGSEDSPSRR